jgi:diguanylate cyclase (GGDEF)-like protein
MAKATRAWRSRCAAALMCVGASVAAAPTPLDLTDRASPVFTVYTTNDGLSDEIWSAVGFDRDGFVWAGSASSLARFDGYRWTPWPVDGASGLVRSLSTDADGNFWTVFEAKGLARYDGRAWTLRDDVPDFIRRLTETTGIDGRLTLWAATDDGLWQLKVGQWHPDPGNASTLVGATVDIETTQRLFGEARQWLASPGGELLYRRIEADGSVGDWQPARIDGLGAVAFIDLLRTEDRGREELWMLTYGHGLVRVSEDGVRVWREGAQGLPSEAMYGALASISPSGERLVWIASRGGLIQVRGDEIRVFDRRHGLPSDAVRNLALQRDVDGADVLWLATEGGVARTMLGASPWQTVSLIGSSYNGVFAVLVEPDERGGERLWVASVKYGLRLLQQGAWRSFDQASGTLPAPGARGLWRLQDENGDVLRLVGLYGGEVYRIDDRLDMHRLATPWPKHPDEAPTAALARVHDGEHELWFGTQGRGVWRRRGGEWTAYDAGDQRVTWHVHALVPQRDDRGRDWIWAASTRGLARFDGERWLPLDDVPNLPQEGYRHVALIRDGDRTILWGSSYRLGVTRIDVTDPARPQLLTDDAIPPPPDATVYSVLQDSRGRIYTCTNNGIQQLTRDDAGRWRERVFRRRDGLVHDECNTNAQSIDQSDRYWAGTLGGLSVYDPAQESTTHAVRAKPLHVTSLRVDGVVQRSDPDRVLALAAGTREILVEFTLLTGLREAETMYRSQLLGFDPAPSAWSHEHRRGFTTLPPGNYELRIEARDYAGTEASPRSLHFSIAPHLWQRSDMRIAALLLAACALVGLVLIYNRNLRARQRRLKREIAARTAALREANQRLTELSYADPLTGVANRRRLTEALDTAIARAVEQGRPIGLIVVDVDHFKRYNDEHGHLAGDAALRAVAQALASATREQDLVARFGGEEFACLMLDSDPTSVMRVAERMRALVEALPPRALGKPNQSLTISAGVFCRVPVAGEQAQDVIGEADAALYLAKRKGRNRICFSTSTASDG